MDVLEVLYDQIQEIERPLDPKTGITRGDLFDGYSPPEKWASLKFQKISEMTGLSQTRVKFIFTYLKALGYVEGQEVGSVRITPEGVIYYEDELDKHGELNRAKQVIELSRVNIRMVLLAAVVSALIGGALTLLPTLIGR